MKRETAHGNRRVVDYHVERVEEETAPVPTPAAAPPRRGPQAVEKDYAAELAAPVAQAAPERDPLTAAGIEAIDAVLAVEAYTKPRGLKDFEFGADNIQKVWISLYID